MRTHRHFVIRAAVLALLVAVPAFALEIKEGTFKKGDKLVHSPGSYLSMNSGSYVSGAFKWDDTKKAFVVPEDVRLESLPSVVKLEVALAREGRSLSGSTATFSSLKEEIEKTANVSKYLAGNRWISWERRDTYKKVYDTDDFGWWGHCNGSAAASLFEKVPDKDVKIHDIPFTPDDFKAYYTLAYSGEFPTDFEGDRSNISSSVYKKVKELLKNPDDPKFLEEMKKLYKEAFYTDAPSSWEKRHFISQFEDQIAAFEDMKPEDFHRFLVESIDSDRGLVIDRSAGNVVWNYPASGYETRIKKKGTQEIDGRTMDVYDVETKVVFGDYTDYSWDWGSKYTYELYVDRDGRAVGGKWTGSSVEDHPDFAWKPRKSLEELNKSWSRRAETKWYRSQARSLEKSLISALKKKGYSNLVDKLKNQDYMSVMSVLKEKNEHGLLGQVGQMESLKQELAFRSIYSGARKLQDKYAPLPAAGPGAVERIEEATGGTVPTEAGSR